MNVKECYAMMGGDYEGVMGRLMTDERIKKFLLKLPQSNPMNEIFENLNNKDYETAFRNVHNMKGVALTPLLERLKADYEKFVEILGQMD